MILSHGFTSDYEMMLDDTERRKYLGKAIYIWENKSLVYGQNFAMTHYHLTRTYISLTEEEWTYTLRSRIVQSECQHDTQPPQTCFTSLELDKSP